MDDFYEHLNAVNVILDYRLLLNNGDGENVSRVPLLMHLHIILLNKKERFV